MRRSTLLLLLSSRASTPRIRLSSTTIAEDAAGDTVVGTLSVSNSPDGVTWTFAFATGGNPDSLWQIINDDEIALETLESLDYETATFHEVTIEATPSVGDPIEETFTINVTDVEESESDSILLETGDALLLETTDPLELNAGIPAQAAADPLDGTEWTVIVQSGTTKKARASLVAGYLNG